MKIQVTKFQSCFFLSLIYFCTASVLTIAQVKKSDAQAPIPVVSNEVYQAIAQFYEYDQNIPLDARIVSKQDYVGESLEKIVFTGVNYSKVPSFLIIPKDGKEIHPVVLIVDGYSGTKERWLQDDSWPLGGLVTKALLKSGFAVMICDLAFHGERNYETGFAGLPWFTVNPYTSRQMIIHTAMDYRRAMDYLATRADIDNTRIGMMGLSMGGMITFQLASIDSRIKTGVAGLTAIFKEHEFQSSTPSTFASHVKSNSFLMFMGNKDPFYTMKEAHQLYDMIPIQKKEFVEYATGHTLTAEYVRLVNDWFLKNL
jgi:cephalosporin-C deacetylase-like acetyl esterase